MFAKQTIILRPLSLMDVQQLRPMHAAQPGRAKLPLALGGHMTPAAAAGSVHHRTRAYVHHKLTYVCAISVLQ